MDDGGLLVVVIVLSCFDAFLLFAVISTCCYCRIQERRHWSLYHRQVNEKTSRRERAIISSKSVEFEVTPGNNPDFDIGFPARVQLDPQPRPVPSGAIYTADRSGAGQFVLESTCR